MESMTDPASLSPGVIPSKLGRGTEGVWEGRAAGTPTGRLVDGRSTGAALPRVAKAAAIKTGAKERIFERIVGVSGETVR